MKLILAGATGHAGRALLPLLVERGHEADKVSWSMCCYPPSALRTKMGKPDRDPDRTTVVNRNKLEEGEKLW
jgi:hypothetical protein